MIEEVIYSIVGDKIKEVFVVLFEHGKRFVVRIVFGKRETTVTWLHITQNIHKRKEKHVKKN